MARTSNESASAKLELAASEGLRVIEGAADSASKVIAQSAAEAIKVLNEAAASATKVVSEAAAVSARVVDSRTGTDHEAIIRIEGSIKSIEIAVKRLEDSDTAKKNNPIFTSEHERRITALDASRTTQVTLTGIGIGLLTILSGLMFYHMIK